MSATHSGFGPRRSVPVHRRRRKSDSPASNRKRRLAIALVAVVNFVLLCAVVWLGIRAFRDDRGGPVRSSPPVAMQASPPVVVSATDDTAANDKPEPAAPFEPELLAAPRFAAEPEPRRERMPPPHEIHLAPAPRERFARERSLLNENDLLKELAWTAEFGLTPDARQGLVLSYQKEYQTVTQMSMQFGYDPSMLLRHVPGVSQLPLRPAPGCQLGPKEALTLGALARKLHAYLDLVAPKDLNGKRREPTQLREALRRERRGKRPEWLRPEAVPAMVQILMAEDVPLRLMLVDLLDEIEGKAATVALAQRAVFDLSPDVRKAAIDALRDRSRSDARPIFVQAFRYPWFPIADHAADALIALDDREAAPLLVAQLGKPDPAAPFANAKGGTSIREVVRINHVANCLLCHAPSISSRDPVRGGDPLTDRPQPSLERRYGQSEGSRGKGIWWNKVVIRADVQFLRQDFSVTFPVGQHFTGMQGLRFDFVVRTRPLKGDELKEARKQKTSESIGYRQRDAALFALRSLTGKDLGTATDAWLQLFPSANAEAEGLRISANLMRALPEQRDPLIARYRDSKDENATEILAFAIPHLSGKLQEKVREALIKRLTRAEDDELRAHLQDEHPEIRRAAALACVRRADLEWTPDLIELLSDSDAVVARESQKALQLITGENFGPSPDARDEDRLAAVERWRVWWRLQSEEKPVDR